MPAPVLRWRILPAADGQSFGAVVPTPAELADAGNATRRLHAVPTGIAAGAAEPPAEEAVG